MNKMLSFKEPNSLMFFFQPYRIRHTLHERKTNTSMESHETKFWKNVRPSNIAGLFAAYRMDFELFGYDPAKYFSQIGLSQKTEEVDMRIREKIAEDSGDPFT